MHRTKKGFTLIELMMIIAIIGLLAAIVLVIVGSARSKARDAKRLSDIRQVATAFEFYFNDKGHYPVSLATTSECAKPGNNWIPDGTNYLWNGPYLPFAPRDPSNTCADSPAHGYTYQSDGREYQMTIEVEGLAEPGRPRQLVYFNGSSFNKNAFSIAASFSSSAQNPTNMLPIPVTLTFAVPVVDFTKAMLTTSNVSFISDLIEGIAAVFTFFVTPQSDGVVIVGLPTGVVHNSQGDANVAAQIQILSETQRPHFALTPDPLPSTINGPFTVSVDSTLPVSGLSASDVAVTNGTASALAAVGESGRLYTFTVTPASAGAVSVHIPENVVQTSAGNSNVTSNTLYTTYAP